MSARKFLNTLLASAGQYTLSSDDRAVIDSVGLHEYLLLRFFSKKFRKWRVDDECREVVAGEVEAALAEDRPIEVFFAQGSYKLWRVSSAPTINWAEFFNLVYLASYLAPIVAAYGKGVHITYYFLTVLPQTHNNLSESEVVVYLESFERLVGVFKQYLPHNLTIRVERDLDSYSRRKYLTLFQRAYAVARRKFYQWPQLKQRDYVRRARLNIKWKGVEGWDKLTDHQKATKIQRAVLYEYAATQVILEKDKAKRGIILSTLPKEGCIGVGSTATSVVKHWVGEGVLEEQHGVYYPRILSPSQYVYAKKITHSRESIGLLPTLLPKDIEVYLGRFDFSQK